MNIAYSNLRICSCCFSIFPYERIFSLSSAVDSNMMIDGSWKKVFFQDPNNTKT